jgi:tetratricopeptide (TPR) repeat protein
MYRGRDHASYLHLARRGPVILSLAMFLAAPNATAADAPAGADLDTKSEAQAAAARLFEEAMSDYDRNDLASAIEKLRAAQLAAPHPRVLFNLAQLLEAVGRRAEAFEHFEAYLTIAGEQLDEQRRSVVRAKLKELEAKLSRLRVEAQPPVAALFVDDVPIETSSETLLDPGSHSIRAAAPGFRAANVTVNAREGEAQRILLALVPETSPTPKPTPSTVVSRSDQRQASSSTSELVQRPSFGSRRWAVVLLGSGTALLAAGAVTQVASSMRSHDWQARDQRLNATPASSRGDAYWQARADNANLARSIRHLDGLGLGLLVGAGAFLTLGAGMWVTTTPSNDSVALNYRHTW